mmetsp:Transcript_5553/g.9689  ORF Transcript_5553/g.9689 Transcript_5553/m.9689 type:complete len:224 (+) Transcript_5553:335-1006(+)
MIISHPTAALDDPPRLLLSSTFVQISPPSIPAVFSQSVKRPPSEYVSPSSSLLLYNPSINHWHCVSTSCHLNRTCTMLRHQSLKLSLHYRPPCRSTSTKMPCGPSRISLKKERRPTHTMGLTSRPPTEGITLRVASRIGSVGANAKTQGNALKSRLGYHVIGMRTMYKTVKIENKGRRTSDSRCAPAASSTCALAGPALAAMPAASTAPANATAPLVRLLPRS